MTRLPARHSLRTRRAPVVLAFSAAAFLVACAAPAAGGDAKESSARLTRDIQYLASDELEGRGVGLAGLDKAADYIRDEFAKAGLKTDAVNGSAFQPFEMPTGVSMGEGNALTLHGPAGESTALELNVDFAPMSIGGAGSVEGELVFAGYGIEVKEKGYDDFAGLDLEGKILLIMRREPRQANLAEGLTGQPRLSSHAEFRSKLAHAAARKAAAVIFVDDPYTSTRMMATMREQLATQKETVVQSALALADALESAPDAIVKLQAELKQQTDRLKAIQRAIEAGPADRLMPFGFGGADSTRAMPVFQITRKKADELLQKSLKTSLAELEAAIDSDLKPRSAALAGWKAAAVSGVTRTRAIVKNVIGVLEGAGELADETIVVGAHYDHVGYGGPFSRSPGQREIHNGADDNASGTVALIEVARKLAARPDKLARRVVFIAFTAEESGLIGSEHYVKSPVFPLENTVAMFNMDMVGRMEDERLTVFGAATSPGFADLLKKHAEPLKLDLALKPEGFGPSDHSSFYGRKIPVLHFFTGVHDDYHRPGDDWEKINVDGMRRIAELVELAVIETANTPQRPPYVSVRGSAQIGRTGYRPYFGSVPDFGSEKPGYALSSVAPGGPADKAGIKGGDRIVKVGEHKITNLDDFDLALRKFRAGQTVPVVVVRDDKEITLNVTLEEPR